MWLDKLRPDDWFLGVTNFIDCLSRYNSRSKPSVRLHNIYIMDKKFENTVVDGQWYDNVYFLVFDKTKQYVFDFSLQLIAIWFEYKQSPLFTSICWLCCCFFFISFFSIAHIIIWFYVININSTDFLRLVLKCLK